MGQRERVKEKGSKREGQRERVKERGSKREGQRERVIETYKEKDRQKERTRNKEQEEKQLFDTPFCYYITYINTHNHADKPKAVFTVYLHLTNSPVFFPLFIIKTTEPSPYLK